MYNKDCLKATRGLLHFHFYSTYPLHDESTLESMGAALAVFHAHKDVFRRFRATKKGRTDAAAKKTELIQQRDLALVQARFQNLSAARRNEMKAEWDEYIDSTIRDQLEEDGDFGFPKLHLLPISALLSAVSATFLNTPPNPANPPIGA